MSKQNDHAEVIADNVPNTGLFEWQLGSSLREVRAGHMHEVNHALLRPPAISLMPILITLVNAFQSRILPGY